MKAEAFNKSWGSTNVLVGLLNNDYLSWVIFKDVKSAVSTYFNWEAAF